jgi:hypothetical protein
MYKFLLFFFAAVVSVKASQYTINDKPLKDYLSPTQQVIELNSGNDDDICTIKISEQNIRVRWGRANIDFDQLGQKKIECHSGLLKQSNLQVRTLTDTGGLIGVQGENAILTFNIGSFTQTSLNFSDTFILNPYAPNSSQVLQSIILTKRSNVKYPMLNGILDWNQAEVLKGFDPAIGFMIIGCDIGLKFDYSKL